MFHASTLLLSLLRATHGRRACRAISLSSGRFSVQVSTRRAAVLLQARQPEKKYGQMTIWVGYAVREATGLLGSRTGPARRVRRNAAERLTTRCADVGAAGHTCNTRRRDEWSCLAHRSNAAGELVDSGQADRWFGTDGRLSIPDGLWDRLCDRDWRCQSSDKVGKA